MNTNSVIDKLSEAMCCGCGICAGICPTQAIDIKISKSGVNYPVLDKSKCSGCGKCKQACPGFGIDLDELNNSVFGKIPDDYLVGNYLNVYKGYTNDSALRYSCSSGGMVTAALVNLLHSGLIQGAIVTRLLYGESIKSQAFIASTESELIESKGSKYCPVALDQALIDLKKNPRKVAVVCLPCHTIALRKAMLVDKVLNDSIRFIFTLFCNQTPSYKALTLFLKNKKIQSSDVRYFQWRGDGWPGKVTIHMREGNDYSFPFAEVWYTCFGSGYFTPLSCYCCQDFLGEFSDISFGDAWLPEQTDDKVGTNVFISRSERGEELLRNMAHDQQILLQTLDVDKLRRAFEHNLTAKKLAYGLHRKVVRNCPEIQCSRRSNALTFAMCVGEYIRLMMLKIGLMYL